MVDCGIFQSELGDTACTVTGHWWLDMDDPANAALLGAPLTVTLVSGDPYKSGPVGGPLFMSLHVSLGKK
jgi:hypothetical protein